MDICIYFFSKSTQPSPLLAFLLCYVTNMYSEYRFRELFPSRCKYREKTIVVFIYIYIYIYMCQEGSVVDRRRPLPRTKIFSFLPRQPAASRIVFRGGGQNDDDEEFENFTDWASGWG